MMKKSRDQILKDHGIELANNSDLLYRLQEAMDEYAAQNSVKGNPVTAQIETILDRYTETTPRMVGRGCNQKAYILSRDFPKIIHDIKLALSDNESESRINDSGLPAKNLGEDLIRSAD